MSYQVGFLKYKIHVHVQILFRVNNINGNVNNN